MYEPDRLFDFEYAALPFSFYQKRFDGTMAVEMGVMPVSAAAADFLKDDEHHHRCFVFGRSIWMKRKGESDV
jgi:hypothetical protein